MAVNEPQFIVIDLYNDQTSIGYSHFEIFYDSGHPNEYVNNLCLKFNNGLVNKQMACAVHMMHSAPHSRAFLFIEGIRAIIYKYYSLIHMSKNVTIENSNRYFRINENNSLMYAIRRWVESSLQYSTGINELSLAKVLNRIDNPNNSLVLPEFIDGQDRLFFKVLKDVSDATKHNLLYEQVQMHRAPDFDRFFAIQEFKRNGFIKSFCDNSGGFQYFTAGKRLAGKSFTLPDSILVEYCISSHQIMNSFLLYADRYLDHEINNLTE